MATKGFEDDSAAIKDMMERYIGKVDYNKKDDADNTDSTDKKDNNYEKAKADVIADFVGEFLFGDNVDKNGKPIKIDTNFLVELKRKDRNLFYRFVDWVNSIIQRLKASGVVDKDIIKLEQKFKRLAEQSVKEREKTTDKESQSGKTDGQYLLPDKYADYDKPITAKDIEVLRSIGRKSINKFEPEDLVKAQKWAYKFYQQLGEKSPFFRAWFGDWRAYDIKNKIPVINKSTAKTFKAGKAENVDTGRYISWGDQIKGETKIKYGTESDVYGFLENIEEIVKNSILLDTNVSVLSSKHKMDNTEFMHSMYSIIEDKDGNECLIKLLVEEAFNDKMTADFSRAYELQEIKKVATLHTGVHSNNGGLTRQVTTSYSISELFDFVKQKDKNFNPNPVNKHLVNEDGTPKKFYHGTKEKFTEFSKKKAKPGFYGRGFYFTTEKSQSNVYGESMEVYLNIKNPLVPGEAKITKNQIIKFLEAVAENEDYSIENYGTYDVNEIANRITNRDAFDVIQDINATAIGDFGEAMQLFNEVNNTNFDGVITPTETVVYDNTKIKSAEKGTPKANIGTFDKTEGDIRYSLPDLDTEYMKAVESGDTETQQRLVDEAAEVWSEGKRLYTTDAETGEIVYEFYRSADGGKTVWNTHGNNQNQGVFLTSDKYVADAFDTIRSTTSGSKNKAKHITVFAKANNPLVIDAKDNGYTSIPADEGSVPDWVYEMSSSNVVWSNEANNYITEDSVDIDNLYPKAFKRGYDAVIVKNVKEGDGTGIIATDVVLKDGGTQIKSAEPVTYDDKGNVIPLSERFNPENEDIRYSLPDDSYNIPDIARGKNAKELYEMSQRGEISTDDALKVLAEEHGRMPQGESPKVDVTVPNKVSEKQGVRRFARTALESGHLTEGMSEEAKREILDGALNYKILSNNMLVRIAENEVKNDISKAIKKWEDLVESGRMPTAREIVLGEVLMVEAAKAGNANDVAMYLAELSAMGTE